MRAWSSPDVPRLPVTGPVVRLHDTATGALVETRPEGPARLYVCGITPYDATHMGHAATYVAFDLLHRAWRNAGHDVTYVQNVTDVDDPLLERADEGQGRLGRAGRARDRSCSATTWRRCGSCRRRTTSAPSSRSRWSSTLIERLDEAGAVYRVDDDLYFSVHRRRRLRRGLRPRPRDDAADLPRARRRPRPRRQEGPARLPAVARRATGRARVGQPVGPGASRLAHRVHRDRPRPPRHRLRRAGRRQRPGLPAPRDVGRPRPGRAPRRARSPGPTSTPGWSPTTARRCRSPRATWSSSPRCAMSEVDPMAIRLVLLRHHYRSDWEWTDDQLWDAVDTLADLAPRAGPRCRRRRRAGRRATSWPPWPTTSTPRPPWPPCRSGSTPPSAPPGSPTPPTARRGDRPPAARRGAGPRALTYASRSGA